MVLGVSRKHNSRPSRHRYRHYKRYSKHRRNGNEKDDTTGYNGNDSANDENTNQINYHDNLSSIKKYNDTYKRKKYVKKTHRRSSHNYNDNSGKGIENNTNNSTQKQHYTSRHSYRHANYKTKSKTSEEEMQLNMGTTDDKNTSSPTIISNLKIDETIDLTEVSKNIDEEEAYFSYFSTNPETVIFGKEEKQVFTPLKKKTVISRIVQMQGVFNISPASIIFKKQRSEIFEQFRSI